jgi:hypothetical protein
MREAIAKPAESSLELFTRKPEDKRCVDVLTEPCDAFKLRWVFKASILVLINEGIFSPCCLNSKCQAYPHEAKYIGRCLEYMRGINGEKWPIIKLPAAINITALTKAANRLMLFPYR